MRLRERDFPLESRKSQSLIDFLAPLDHPFVHLYRRFARRPFRGGGSRTKPRPSDTAVMGSSLGGVVSFYLGWQRPKVFGKVACLSSTFTYQNDLIDRVAAEPKRDLKIYLDSGWPRDNYEATRSMRDRVIWKGYRPGSELQYLALPEAKHDENAWAARSPIPFQFLFAKHPEFPRPAS